MNEYYIFADSTNRDTSLYPHANAYTLHLTKPLRNVTRVELVSARFPNTIYNIQGGSFSVNSCTFTVPPGFFTADGIADYVTKVAGINSRYLPDEGKILFTWDNQFTLSVTGAQLQKLMGLSSVSSSVDSSGLHSAKSVHFVDTSTHEFVFLDIEELRNSRVVDSKKIIGDNFDGTTMATSFAMIPLDVDPMDVKSFKETTDYKISIQFDYPIPRISRLTVRWMDQTGVPVTTLNNSFLLRVMCNPSAPPEEKESEYDILAKKLERAIQDAIPPPKPEKKRPWILPMFIILLALIGYLYFKIDSMKSSPQPGHWLKTPTPRV